MVNRSLLLIALSLQVGCFFTPWVEDPSGGSSSGSSSSGGSGSGGSGSGGSGSGGSGSSGSGSDTSWYSGDCYDYGYDDACDYYSPDPDFYNCNSSSEVDDYCSGYCEGEIDCFGDHYECNSCG
jgi:hypothetical protein